jgi:hypothetical protein
MQPMGRLWIIARAIFVASLVSVAAGPAVTQQLGQPALQATGVYSESEVKAAFLYHFGTYVQWPSAARGEDVAITIAVLGAPAVASDLEAFLPGRKIEGRPVQTRRLARIQDLREEEVLFIGREYNGRLAEIVGAASGKPVLIVTDAPDGLDRGAMVNFQLVSDRVRFEISLAKAQDAGLMLSSRLLSAALRVVTSSCCAEPSALSPLLATLRDYAERPRAWSMWHVPCRARGPLPRFEELCDVRQQPHTRAARWPPTGARRTA